MSLRSYRLGLPLMNDERRAVGEDERENGTGLSHFGV
jgi:hypothetical protein